MRVRVSLSVLTLALAFVACKPKPAPAPEPPAAEPPASVVSDKVVVFDAGSSGTRAHVYAPGGGPGGLVDLTPDCDDGPPLADAGPEAVLALWPCIEDNVPAKELATVPTRVYATAGMRSLAETEPDRVAKIHADTAEALRQKGLADVASRTLEGIEEAHFAWIATNVTMDSLGDAPLGILELGGASTQIAFVPDDPAAATETLSLDGREYPLFAVSYLHCGANETRVAMAPDSCFFPKCEADEVCAETLAGTPASKGKGKFPSCTKALDKALRAEGATCPVVGETRPAMAGHTFVLLSTFSYLINDYRAVSDRGTADLKALWAAAKTACPTAWPKLGEPLSAVDAGYRGNYCFEAALTKNLLDLYGLGETDTLMVLGTSPEWTLGVAYLETEDQRASEDRF